MGGGASGDNAVVGEDPVVPIRICGAVLNGAADVGIDPYATIAGRRAIRDRAAFTRDDAAGGGDVSAGIAMNDRAAPLDPDASRSKIAAGGAIGQGDEVRAFIPDEAVLGGDAAGGHGALSNDEAVAISGGGAVPDLRAIAEDESRAIAGGDAVPGRAVSEGEPLGVSVVREAQLFGERVAGQISPHSSAGPAADGAVADGEILLRDRDVDSAECAAATAAQREPIQVERHVIGLDADPMFLRFAGDVAGQIVRAGLRNDEGVSLIAGGIGGVHDGARLNLIERFHRRPRLVGRDEAALRVG